jgi:hypothetical protein
MSILCWALLTAICLISRLVHERTSETTDGDERLLLAGETWRLYQHCRRLVHGGHDPARRRTERRPPETKAPFHHLQLHAADRRGHRQGARFTNFQELFLTRILNAILNRRIIDY